MRSRIQGFWDFLEYIEIPDLLDFYRSISPQKENNKPKTINFITMDSQKKVFASKLLKVKAIKLQPENPFTWASGWKSPF